MALGLKPGDADYEPTRLQFLEDYAAESTVHSKLFPGIVELLAGIRERGLSWGIVTNKVTYLTLPIVEFLDLTRESAVLVCGDTTAHAKPHPLPLQHAAREAGFAVERCVYVGDDLRDIQAAHAAGMPVRGRGLWLCGRRRQRRQLPSAARAPPPNSGPPSSPCCPPICAESAPGRAADVVPSAAIHSLRHNAGALTKAPPPRISSFCRTICTTPRALSCNASGLKYRHGKHPDSGLFFGDRRRRHHFSSSRRPVRPPTPFARDAPACAPAAHPDLYSTLQQRSSTRARLHARA